MKMKYIYSMICGALLLTSFIQAKAQLNPLAVQYYSNEYLINPAYAGKQSGLKLNAAYRKLWSGIPGAPLSQNITADYGFKRVGIGINVNNESAGLLKQTRMVGSYAYHLPVGDKGQQLHFGVSLGLMDQRLSSGQIKGEPNDPLAQQYNQRETYIDGDFGVAYNTDRLKLEVSLPNLNSLLKRSEIKLADVATFYAAASYSLVLMGELDGIILEPKLAYRGVRNYDNMFDMGAQATFADRKFLAMAMYHSNESATLGLGLDYMRKYLIYAMYTSQTSALNTYANGSFELNLRINFGK